MAQNCGISSGSALFAKIKKLLFFITEMYYNLEVQNGQLHTKVHSNNKLKVWATN